MRPENVDETLCAGETPADYVLRVARAKADALWGRDGRDDVLPVLGSDTAVVLDGQVFGKPRDRDDAIEMLERLSARTHEVYTGVALRSSTGSDFRLSVSEVTFRRLAPAEIAAYWQSGEPADKAGAYAVQGLAAVFIERIAGSYSGIMGLPLFETAELLDQVGIRVPGSLGQH
ncbi:MAG TPA: Maf family protein [Steroidobacteraceae bacterium]|nr:Maf family protein [Steroidobacteraceae bacterium]